MCGRFYIDPDDMTDAELIALLERESVKESSVCVMKGEVFPGNCAAVIAMNRRLQRSAFVMEWGYKTERHRIINARSETAAIKPLFRHSTQFRRCLIPASAYFEWDHSSSPFRKYRFRSPDEKYLYLAGLYRFEPNDSLPCFTILTREAAPELSCFHDRMPVIIPPGMTDAWLDHASSFGQLLLCSHTKLIWEDAK